jgi:myo-inositol-1(or 4)-monophosphatase
LVRDCLIATGWPYDHEEYGRVFNNLSLLSDRCQEVRTVGSAALNLCYVASGAFDGYWEWDLQPWDVAGGAVIALEAGCRLTALDGKPFRVDGSEVLASNGLIHQQMVELFQDGGNK